MAIVYNIKNIIACIETLEPILAAEIQALALARLVQLGESADPDACQWTSTKPGNCNIGAIRNVIINITDVGDLQQIEDCARLICVLDDEESSTSSSSTSTSSDSWSESSFFGINNCDNYDVPTPQSYETDTSTLPIVIDPLGANVYWDDAKFVGDFEVQIVSVLGGNGGTLVKDNGTGEITYTPNPDGSEAGSRIRILMRYLRAAPSCFTNVYIVITITEQTTD